MPHGISSKRQYAEAVQRARDMSAEQAIVLLRDMQECGAIALEDWIAIEKSISAIERMARITNKEEKDAT